MRQVLILTSIIALCAFLPQSHMVDHKIELAPATAGTYKLDRAHASLIFRVNHLGLSHYTARFRNFDATLQFDPNNPARSQVNAVVEVSSLETDFPFPKPNFNAQLLNAEWLNVAKYPKITFRSTGIKITSPSSASIIGELTMHGFTHPITLFATFNGGYASHPYDQLGSRIGFSARGSLNRSAFGITQGIPAKGSSIGVGDKVEIIIEAEFIKPITASSAIKPAKIPKPNNK